MVYVVTGVSGSGKSEYAENLAVRLSGGTALYYAATMQPFGEEGRARVMRHRKLREGKKFTTIECYRDIVQLPKRIAQTDAGRKGTPQSDVGQATILIECMSNLLANEMFGTDENGGGSGAEDGEKMTVSVNQQAASCDVVEKILSEMSCLSRQCKHIVIVTNEVFADAAFYEKETEDYRGCLGRLNRGLAELADEAVEVVYTIPMRIKAAERNSSAQTET